MLPVYLSSPQLPNASLQIISSTNDLDNGKVFWCEDFLIIPSRFWVASCTLLLSQRGTCLANSSVTAAIPAAVGFAKEVLSNSLHYMRLMIPRLFACPVSSSGIYTDNARCTTWKENTVDPRESAQAKSSLAIFIIFFLSIEETASAHYKWLWGMI